MAAKQLDWCQHNQDTIVKKANKLYAMVQSEKASVFLNRLKMKLEKEYGIKAYITLMGK